MEVATEGNNGGHQEGENDDCECTLGGAQIVPTQVHRSQK